MDLQQAIPSVEVENLALAIGFDGCGISQAEYLALHDEPFSHWLNAGFHGEMGYMERNREKRLNPQLLVPGAKSVISVILSYKPQSDSLSLVAPKISRYAYGRDYHLTLKEMLYELLNQLRANYGAVDGRAFVDSAPVLDRAWAEKAGLGWIGKNSMLISPKLGSYIFIGELIVNLDIEPTSRTVPNRCGTCTRCIDACPTGAIVAPRTIDARKCISYLTIEKKSALTSDERNSLNGWAFGCDACQEACPWNQKPLPTRCADFTPLDNLSTLKSNPLQFTPELFSKTFEQSPLARAGFTKVQTLLKP